MKNSITGVYRLTATLRKLYISQNHTMVWVESNIKYHLIPTTKKTQERIFF